MWVNFGHLYPGSPILFNSLCTKTCTVSCGEFWSRRQPKCRFVPLPQDKPLLTHSACWRSAVVQVHVDLVQGINAWKGVRISVCAAADSHPNSLSSLPFYCFISWPLFPSTHCANLPVPAPFLCWLRGISFHTHSLHSLTHSFFLPSFLNFTFH